MPTEREKIEAELGMSEKEKSLADLKRVIADFDELERDLEAREAELGLPSFYRSKPLAERLAAVGVSKEAIAKINLMLEAFDVIRRTGDVNDYPEPVKQMLAKVADAEYSALDQLAALRESRRKPKPTT
jgi:hypothetical protein